MTEEEVFKGFEANTRRALSVIDAMSAGVWQRRPAENAWSPMEVFQHMLLSERGFGGLMKGPQHPAGRPALEKAGPIAAAMADRTKPRQAPERVHPPANQPLTQAEASAAFAEGRAKSLEKARAAGLDKELEGWQHPAFGLLTVGELLVFIYTHCERHLDQIGERMGV